MFSLAIGATWVGSSVDWEAVATSNRCAYWVASPQDPRMYCGYCVMSRVWRWIAIFESKIWSAVPRQRFGVDMRSTSCASTLTCV